MGGAVAGALTSVGSFLGGEAEKKGAKEQRSLARETNTQNQAFLRDAQERQLQALEEASGNANNILGTGLEAQQGFLRDGANTASGSLQTGFNNVGGILNNANLGYQVGNIIQQQDLESAFNNANTVVPESYNQSNQLLTQYGDQALNSINAGADAGITAVAPVNDLSQLLANVDFSGVDQNILNANANVDQTDRRIDIAGESLNRELAARGLLDSGKGIEAQIELRDRIVADEQQKQFDRNLQLASLGLNRAGAEANVLGTAGNLSLGAAGLTSDIAGSQGAQAAEIQARLGNALSENALGLGQTQAGLGLDQANSINALRNEGLQQTLNSQLTLADLAQQNAQQNAAINSGLGADLAQAQAQADAARANAYLGQGSQAAQSFGNLGAGLAASNANKGIAMSQATANLANARSRQFQNIFNAQAQGVQADNNQAHQTGMMAMQTFGGMFGGMMG